MASSVSLARPKSDLHIAVLPDHDVVGLNIAVNYPGSVRFFERTCSLNCDIEDLVQLESSPAICRRRVSRRCIQWR